MTIVKLKQLFAIKKYENTIWTKNVELCHVIYKRLILLAMTYLHALRGYQDLIVPWINHQVFYNFF